MEIQNSIGADIMMQLDDVVDVKVTGPRVEEAMHRSIRWLDRCIEGHQRKEHQNLFPIIQGGLNLELRTKCIEGRILFCFFYELSFKSNYIFLCFFTIIGFYTNKSLWCFYCMS